MPEVQIAWRADTLLGEGPGWLEERKRLVFVDIKGGRICLFDPVAAADRGGR